MDIINVGIYTNDTEYGIALGNKLAHFQREYLVWVRSREELDSNEKAKEMDLVLIDGSFENTPQNYVELVESRSCTTENTELMVFRLYKYGNIQEMALKLLYIYGRISGRRQVSIYNKSSRIVFFCSPYGGCGVTSISKGIAEENSRYMDKKVIHLTLEEIQETEENSEIRSLGEYLYHIEKDNNMATYIESFLVQDQYGFDRFRKAGGRNPLSELAVDEFVNFVNHIANTQRYDYILIDSGQSFSESIIMLMRHCHKICLVESGFRNSCRSEVLEEYLKNKIGDDCVSKLIKVINNCSYGDEEDLNRETSQTIVTNLVEIDYDPKSFNMRGQKSQASIDLDFGKGIKNLAKMLM